MMKHFPPEDIVATKVSLCVGITKTEFISHLVAGGVYTNKENMKVAHADHGKMQKEGEGQMGKRHLHFSYLNKVIWQFLDTLGTQCSYS